MKDRKREEKLLGLGQVKQREASRGQVSLSRSSQEDTKKSRPVGCQSEKRIFQEGRCPRTLTNAEERAS